MKARILSLIVVAVLMMVAMPIVYAKEPVSPSYDNYLTPEDIEEYREQTQQQIEKGYEAIASMKLQANKKHILRAAANSTLGVQLMRQDASRWASTLIPGSNYTYSDAGCAMTSYAMVFSYYGSNVTPVDVGNTYYNRTNPQQSPIDFNVRTLVPMYSRSISAIDTVSSRSSLEAVIVGGIFSGYPTVLKMTRSNGDTHFIVAYGCFQATASDPTIIYIRDPESHINYSTLNKYYDKGWTAANYVTVS